MADEPRLAQDGYIRPSPLTEGYVRKGGQNPPPQSFDRPPPPPAFRPAPSPAPQPPVSPKQDD